MIDLRSEIQYQLFSRKSGTTVQTMFSFVLISLGLIYLYKVPWRLEMIPNMLELGIFDRFGNCVRFIFAG